MKEIESAFVMVLTLRISTYVGAQGFLNLDFESANIPAGALPGDLIPFADAFPGWTG